jgi:membrane protease YdiL (CAAX protease family)
MTDLGPGAAADGEPYAGPPPMIRPAPLPWQWQPWPPQQWQQAQAPWPQQWQQAQAPWPQQWQPAPWQQLPPRPSVRWAPPPGTPPHDVPQPYLRAMRARDWAWWRPLLGLLLLGVVYLVAATVTVVVALLTGVAPDLELLDLVDPVTLLVTNLSLIVAIPVVWLAWAGAHGMSTGWSSSVLARFRWGLLLPFTLRALVTVGAGIGVSVLLAFLLVGDAPTGPVRSVGWLVLVVVVTTPLQSAAEEYLFRGYLSQSIAGWIRSPRTGAVIAAVVTAALFSAAHLPPDLETFLDRFAFGLAASAVVWLTGGLEAAVVLHAVNNVVVFVLAGLLGEGVATVSVPDGLGYLFLLVTLVSMGGYVWLVARSRSRLRPETTTGALDLRPPGLRPPTAPAPVPAG